MKMFEKFGFGQKLVCLTLLMVAGTATNYIIHLQSKVSNLTGLLTLAEMRSNVNTDWANEVTWNAINNNSENMLKEQGKIEGILV